MGGTQLIHRKWGKEIWLVAVNEWGHSTMHCHGSILQILKFVAGWGWILCYSSDVVLEFSKKNDKKLNKKQIPGYSMEV